jgi:hypothetical protein
MSLNYPPGARSSFIPKRPTSAARSHSYWTECVFGILALESEPVDPRL